MQIWIWLDMNLERCFTSYLPQQDRAPTVSQWKATTTTINVRGDKSNLANASYQPRSTCWHGHHTRGKGYWLVYSKSRFFTLWTPRVAWKPSAAARAVEDPVKSHETAARERVSIHDNKQNSYFKRVILIILRKKNALRENLPKLGVNV